VANGKHCVAHELQSNNKASHPAIYNTTVATTLHLTDVTLLSRPLQRIERVNEKLPVSRTIILNLLDLKSFIPGAMLQISPPMRIHYEFGRGRAVS
jgi:hypothetical protein